MCRVRGVQNLDERNTWKDIPYSWPGKVSIFKMSVRLKLSHKVSTTAVNIPAVFFFF